MSQVVLAAALIGAAYYLSSQSDEAGAASNTGSGMFSILGSRFEQLQEAISREGRMREGLVQSMLGEQQIITGLSQQILLLSRGQSKLSDLLAKLGQQERWIPEVPNVPELVRNLTAGGGPLIPGIPSYTSKPTEPGRTWSDKANELGMKAMSLPWQFGKGALWDYPYAQGLKMRGSFDQWVNRVKDFGSSLSLSRAAEIGSFITPFAVMPLVPGASQVALLSKLLPVKSEPKSTRSKTKSTSSGTSSTLHDRIRKDKHLFGRSK